MNNDQPKIDFNQIPKHQVEALCRTLLKWKAQRDKNEEKYV